MCETVDNPNELDQVNDEKLNELNTNSDNFSPETEKNIKTDKSLGKKKDRKLKEEIEYLKLQNEELKDKYLRIVAEYENFRKRSAKEKLELREETKISIMASFIQIIDDMDRAMQHLGDVKDVESTIEGVKLINQKFIDFLKLQGIEEINAENQEFNLDLHEAITRFPVTEEEKKGKIVDVIQKGYKINDKIIRYSKVVVGE